MSHGLADSTSSIASESLSGFFYLRTAVCEQRPGEDDEADLELLRKFARVFFDGVQAEGVVEALPFAQYMVQMSRADGLSFIPAI